MLADKKQGSSYTPQKKKGGFFSKKYERTPPVTPDDKYDVAVVASEYDPSQSFGFSPPKPVAPYPSTPMRKVEFKPNKAPPVFTPPPALTPERVLANTQNVAQTAKGLEDPPAKQPPVESSLYSQTLNFIDDICQVPKPKEEGQQRSAPEWGTAPSGEEDGSTFEPSYQTSTYGGTDGYTDYSKSYLTSRGSVSETSEPREETIEHENFEVVLDTTNLNSSSSESPKRKSRGNKEESKLASAAKAEGKRSLVKRLFSSRKKDDLVKEEDVEPEKAEDPLQELSSYDDPEIQDDAAVMDYPELREENCTDPPAQHDRELQVSSAPNLQKSRSDPPAAEVPPDLQRSLSPVEEVLNSIGSMFSYYNTEEEKKEEEPSTAAQEGTTQLKGSDDLYGDMVGPEDEVEENLTPNGSFMDPEDRDVHGAGSTPQEDGKESAKDKTKRTLTLGTLAKRISKPFARKKDDKTPSTPDKAVVSNTSASMDTNAVAGVVASEQETATKTEAPVKKKKQKKNKPLWKSTVDPKTGRTYWYNRVTRESTYNPPPEAFEGEGTEAVEKETEPAKKETEAAKTAQQEETSAVTVAKIDGPAETEAKEISKAAPAASPKRPAPSPARSAASAKAASVAASPERKTKKPLWKAVVDKNSGRTYYYHRKTRETTWTMPEEFKAVQEEEKNPEELAAVEEQAEDKPVNEGVSNEEITEDTPLQVVQAELSEESKERINKGEKGLLDNSYELEEDTEEPDLFETPAAPEEKPFDEPVVDVGDIPMTRASPPRMGSRTTTFLSKASATTKSSVKTDKTERIRNTGALGRSKGIETISETMSSTTSISSHHDEVRLNTPDRVGAMMRPRELKVEDLTDSRVAAETYDRSGRVLYGQFDRSAEDTEDGSYYGDNEVDTYGDDSVSALSEADNDFSHRKENFEQARRRALDDAIEREDWDLAAALSEGMRATTTTSDYAKAHDSWNQSDLDKFIADNDWDAVKSYIARMREAKKAGQEEMPPPITKTYSAASDPTVRMATTSRTVSSPPTISETSSFPYEKRIGSRSQAQHDRIQQREESQDSESYDSGDDSTEMSRSLDEDTYDSEYS